MQTSSMHYTDEVVRYLALRLCPHCRRQLRTHTHVIGIDIVLGEPIPPYCIKLATCHKCHTSWSVL